MNPLNPRIKIHINKQATLAGLHYADLRSIFDAAAIHYYDSLSAARKENDVESIQWYQYMIKVMDRTKLAMDKGIADTYPPRSNLLTKQERLARVMAERKERLFLDQLLEDFRKSRKIKKKKGK